MYNSHILCNLSEKEIDYINRSAVLAYNSTAIREDQDKTSFAVSNSSVYAQVQRGEFQRTVSYRRLTYLPRYFAKAPLALTVALQLTAGLPSSWTAQVEADLVWLRSYSPEFASLRLHTWKNIKEFVTHNGQRWKQLCKQALQQYHLHFSSKAAADHGTHHILKEVADFLVEPGVAASGYYVCYHCGDAFQTWSGLTNHRRYKHNEDPIDADKASRTTLSTSLRDRIGRRISNTRCRLCLKDFHNRTRLLRHMYRVPLCRHWYLETIPEIPTDLFHLLADDERIRVREARKRGELPWYA